MPINTISRTIKFEERFCPRCAQRRILLIDCYRSQLRTLHYSLNILWIFNVVTAIINMSALPLNNRTFLNLLYFAMLCSQFLCTMSIGPLYSLDQSSQCTRRHLRMSSERFEHALLLWYSDRWNDGIRLWNHVFTIQSNLLLDTCVYGAWFQMYEWYSPQWFWIQVELANINSNLMFNPRCRNELCWNTAMALQCSSWHFGASFCIGLISNRQTHGHKDNKLLTDNQSSIYDVIK